MNMIGYDENRIITEEQAQQVHVIRNNNDINVYPKVPTNIIRDNDDNKGTPNATRDNNNNKVQIRIRKDYQQHSKRTREQKINDIYILKQQIDYQDGLLAHDSVDKTREWTEEFSKHFELVYEKTKEYAEYKWFDSDNNKRCISSSAAMKDTYQVVNPFYKAKGWKQSNGWIEKK